MKYSKQNIHRQISFVWQSIAPYKWPVIGQWILRFVRVLLGNIIVPLYIKQVFDLIFSQQDPSLEFFHAEILPVFIILSVLLFIEIPFTWLNDTLLTRFHPRIFGDIYKKVFQHLQGQSYTFFESTHVGGLTSKTTQLAGASQTLINAVDWNFIPMVTVFTLSFAVLFQEDPLLALIFAVWIVIFATVTLKILPEKMKLDTIYSHTQAKVVGTLSDIITNTLNVKVFAKRQTESSDFEKDLDQSVKEQQDSWYVSRKLATATKGVSQIAIIALLGISFYLWSTGRFSIGTIALLQIYIFNISRQLDLFGHFSKAVARAFATAQPMMDILETKPTILDPKKPEKVKIKAGNITFDDLTFQYDQGKGVFKNFSLDIKAGEKIGLVGQSGSGKSTITKLLLRFVDPQTGALKIDGQNIAKINQDDLRRNITYVPQEPMLFHRTIKENIAYAKPDATQKEIESVAKKAHAHEFIMDLPEGYDTVVGERGMKLSGGERQRVAIARAMLKDAPIIILDEATSALDTISEKLIQEALWKLMQGKTAVVIAHRLSTVQNLDRIIVMNKGAVKQDGSHAELIKEEGAYKKLWQYQNDGFLQS